MSPRRRAPTARGQSPKASWRFCQVVDGSEESEGAEEGGADSSQRSARNTMTVTFVLAILSIFGTKNT
ncbi:hypothetical protein N7491_004181 [Penicillium cf. griseofulvum]|nr:hypothetical protein N7445_006182 [Penicillium cf. griseofulvum]KAJ5441775.1 hypothetical protein N7491_004181 [Penicillium cf. griseofulvum]